jgi:hypothetical protein
LLMVLSCYVPQREAQLSPTTVSTTHIPEIQISFPPKNKKKS